MEWSKAKNILIVLLLLLNLSLVLAIFARFMDTGGTIEVYRGVMSILDARGITIGCNIPNTRIEKPNLVYENNRMIDDSIPVLQAQVSTETTEQMDADIRRIMADGGVDLSSYVLDGVMPGVVPGDNNVNYLLSYEGELVFDSWVNLLVDESGAIRTVRGNYRTVKGFSDKEQTAVLPVYLVLLKQYMTPGPAISEIHLGFMSQSGSGEDAFKESEEGAVWRIRQEDGTTRFFEALYGDEIVE